MSFWHINDLEMLEDEGVVGWNCFGLAFAFEDIRAINFNPILKFLACGLRFEVVNGLNVVRI